MPILYTQGQGSPQGTSTQSMEASMKLHLGQKKLEPNFKLHQGHTKPGSLQLGPEKEKDN